MKKNMIRLAVVVSLFSGATLLAQNESRIQLTGSNGNRTIIEPAALTATRTITVPDVSGTFFIVPSAGGGGTANQLTRFGTTTGTLLDGSLSDNGAGTLSRGSGLTLDVTTLSITGQTAFNVGSGGAFSMPISVGRVYDALTYDGAASTSFNPVPPVGTVSMFAGATAPAGYLLCNGAAVSRTTYADLFAVIGTTYGVGDGVNTFNLPNVSNRNVVGPGSRAVGATGGAETHTLTTAEMPSHNHSASSSTTTSLTGGVFAIAESFNQSGYATGVFTMVTGYSANNTPSTGLDASNGGGFTFDANHSHTITVNNTGGGGSHNIMDPYLIMNFIIKY
jgi:microcystin-dependent protein